MTRIMPTDLEADQAAILLRLPTVMRITGLPRSTIYLLMAQRRFPSPIKVGARVVAWRRADLDRWSEAHLPHPH